MQVFIVFQQEDEGTSVIRLYTEEKDARDHIDAFERSQCEGYAHMDLCQYYECHTLTT